MKASFFIFFLFGYLTVMAQPPIGNATTNSNLYNTNLKQTAISEKQEEESLDSKASVLSISEFYQLHQLANSSPNLKNPTLSSQVKMDDFVEGLHQLDANSFEYHLSSFMAGNFDLSRKNHLDLAKKMEPANRQVLLQTTGVAFILKDKKAAAADLKALKEQNTWSADEYAYAKDVLTSLPPDAVLITNGFNDTYPILSIQLLENYRSDVMLMPLFLLQSEDFQKSANADKLIQSNKGLINGHFLSTFLQKNHAEKTFIALTVPSSFYTKLLPQLYPIGLAFQYSSSSVSNSTINLQLWKQLNKTVISKNKDTNGKQLSANYLPLLVNLFEYHKAENNVKELTEVKAAIKQIGNNIGNEQLISELGLKE
jgi:hypothetical protein